MGWCLQVRVFGFFHPSFWSCTCTCWSSCGMRSFFAERKIVRPKLRICLEMQMFCFAQCFFVAVTLIVPMLPSNQPWEKLRNDEWGLFDHFLQHMRHCQLQNANVTTKNKKTLPIYRVILFSTQLWPHSLYICAWSSRTWLLGTFLRHYMASYTKLIAPLSLHMDKKIISAVLYNLKGISFNTEQRSKNN